MIYFPLLQNESCTLRCISIRFCSPEAPAFILHCSNDSDFVGEQHGSSYFALRYIVLYTFYISYFEASDKKKKKPKQAASNKGNVLMIQNYILIIMIFPLAK